MRRKSNKNQRGFTIIELLVATLVFSVLLIVMLAAFIRTGDLFYKGVSMSKTQEDARNIVQSISSDIQFTNAQPPIVTATISSNPSSGVFCIGQHRYAYQIGSYVTPGGNYGLARDNVTSGCPAISTSPSGTGTQPLNSSTGEVQMLDSGMQLNSLSIACNGGQVGYCTITIHVIFYGGSPSDLFTTPCIVAGNSNCSYTSNPWQAPDAQCTGSLNDTDLCATVDYSSTVLVNI